MINHYQKRIRVFEVIINHSIILETRQFTDIIIIYFMTVSTFSLIINIIIKYLTIIIIKHILIYFDFLMTLISEYVGRYKSAGCQQIRIVIDIE